MAVLKHLIGDSAAILERSTGLRFSARHRGQEVPAFVVRTEGRLHAYVNQCAHVPVELDWQEGEFFDLTGYYLICATHGAYYRPEDGICVGGPCPGRRLQPLVVVEEDGKVYWQEALAET